MNDERYTPALGTWLKDTDVTPPDPQSSASRIMTGLPEREKRRSWWPFHRRTASVASPRTDQTADYQPSPIPATNGPTPTVTGRTQFMFSPAKSITAGAIVFALGGVLLIAQPFDQQGGSVPGAATQAEPVIAADDLLVASEAARYVAGVADQDWLIVGEPAFTAADYVEEAFADDDPDQDVADYTDEVAAEVGLLGLMPEDVSFYVWSLQRGTNPAVHLAVIRLAGADPDALLEWLVEAKHTPQMFSDLSWEDLEPTQIGDKSAYRTDVVGGLDAYAYFVGDTVVVYAESGGIRPLNDERAEVATAFFGALPIE